MDTEEGDHICRGESPMRRKGDADLKDNGALWSELWELHRDALLPEYVERNPGTRPAVFWKFDAPEERDENEPEVEYLHRHGLLAPAEIAAITAQARALAAYNVGRHGNDPTSNYLPPHDPEEWAVNQGYLSDEETELLSPARWYIPAVCGADPDPEP